MTGPSGDKKYEDWRRSYTRMPFVMDSVQLYSEYVTREAVEGFGNFKIGQVICTAKYADDLELLAEEETALQGMSDRLIQTGRCYRMEINVEKSKVMRVPWQASPVQIMLQQKQ